MPAARGLLQALESPKEWIVVKMSLEIFFPELLRIFEWLL